ncbi:MAG: hypothetical protein OEW83_20715 [Acidimicrobiia bacterium]|nr:hypothetical protein [Acidimicrobiia bacterium]
MNLEKINIARRLASLALALALAIGGLQGLASHDAPDTQPADEVAGATWSRTPAPSSKGGGGATTNGATWS